MAPQEGFSVGGIRYPRPFKIRRLCHFGLNVQDPIRSLAFYRETLGFRVSDPLDFAPRLPEGSRDKLGQTTGYFLRHGTEHHSLVLFPKPVMNAIYPRADGLPAATINQITWQVGSLEEVVGGHKWFSQRGKKINRAGRDTPGSNWHFYPFDPAGIVNELSYGIEQIGWDGYSKPAAVHAVRYQAPPDLPHVSEELEVNDALARGVALNQGSRDTDRPALRFNVEGVLLGRPFKVTRVGPVRLFVDNMEQALSFYGDELGLTMTEVLTFRGHCCYFLRSGTEHHSIALYPTALRPILGLNPETPLLSFGIEVGSYSQLCMARSFLQDRGVSIRYLPTELTPGIAHNFLAIDPDGYAMQLYAGMEQIGWNGLPRPGSLRRRIDNDRWPETLEPQSDTYAGEPFLGPLG